MAAQHTLGPLVTALEHIRDARDYHAEYGRYPAECLAQLDQQFDDWAADVAEIALAEARNTHDDLVVAGQAVIDAYGCECLDEEPKSHCPMCNLRIALAKAKE